MPTMGKLLCGLASNWTSFPSADVAALVLAWSRGVAAGDDAVLFFVVHLPSRSSVQFMALLTLESPWVRVLTWLIVNHHISCTWGNFGPPFDSFICEGIKYF